MHNRMDCRYYLPSSTSSSSLKCASNFVDLFHVKILARCSPVLIQSIQPHDHSAYTYRLDYDVTPSRSSYAHLDPDQRVHHCSAYQQSHPQDRRSAQYSDQCRQASSTTLYWYVQCRVIIVFGAVIVLLIRILFLIEMCLFSKLF
jgi:hypothetical protein